MAFNAKDSPRGPTPLCFYCKHVTGAQRCEAFAGKIPIEITSCEFDHRQKHPLDNGLLFEPIPDNEDKIQRAIKDLAHYEWLKSMGFI